MTNLILIQFYNWSSYRTNILVRTVPQSNRKIIESYNIDASTTHIHERTLFKIGIGISIKSDGVRQIYLVHTSPLMERPFNLGCGESNFSTSYFGRIGIKPNVSNAIFYIHIFDY